jgi:hypothetical protein
MAATTTATAASAPMAIHNPRRLPDCWMGEGGGGGGIIDCAKFAAIGAPAGGGGGGGAL